MYGRKNARRKTAGRKSADEKMSDEKMPDEKWSWHVSKGMDSLFDATLPCNHVNIEPTFWYLKLRSWSKLDHIGLFYLNIRS